MIAVTVQADGVIKHNDRNYKALSLLASVGKQVWIQADRFSGMIQVYKQNNPNSPGMCFAYELASRGIRLDEYQEEGRLI